MTTKNSHDIKPHKGLGHFKLQDTINKILSIIKANGDRYNHADVILGDQATDPIYIMIPKEGLKLRFDGFNQRLEMIEILFNQTQMQIDTEFSYKGNLIFSTRNKEHAYYSCPNYTYINEIFGTSKVPKLIDNDKIILQAQEGISFLFYNNQNTNEVFDALLYKIVIYEENNLSDSLNKDNLKLNNPSPIIKYDVSKPDKGLSIQNFTRRIYNSETSEFYWKQDEPIFIFLNDSLEEILHKLRNPNYVYEKNQSTTTVISTEGNSSLTNDFFLNYYSLGMDVLIDGNSKTNKLKKIILHCNNPSESKFGIYIRSNFVLEFNRNYFKENLETRKVSEEYVTEQSNHSNSFQLDTELLVSLYSIDKIGSFSLVNGQEEEVSTHDRKQKQKGTRKNKERNNQPKEIDKEEYSSIEQSNNDKSIQSLSFTTEPQYHNCTIYPWTNFGDVINKVPSGSYSVYQRHDTKINLVYKYYLFEGIIFEVLENNTIVSVIIYKKE